MVQHQEVVEIPYLKEKGTHFIFESGYQFVFVPKPGDVFNISTWVKTGSIHENPNNNGVSHFLEHLMFKGSERFKPGEFDQAMESMGAVINAATWKDFTYYYISGPNTNEGKTFEKALDMHADMLLCSTLPEHEIGEIHDPNDTSSTATKRERGVVIEEIGMRGDQPWTKVYNTMNHMMYPVGHPYQRDVIGTKEIIAAIPRQDIMDYYNAWYSAPNMCTIVIGDFEIKRLLSQIESVFDFSHRKSPPGKALSEGSTSLNGSNTERYAQICGDYQTSFFIIGYHGPKSSNLKESIALDIASMALGEGRSSRLYQAFIERPRKPIFNTISCGQSSFKLGNVFYVQGNFNSRDDKQMMEQVQAEIHKFVEQEPITPAEFERAIKKLKVDFAETSETASGIAEAIGETYTITGQFENYIKYLDTLATITREDVIVAARNTLSSEKHYTATLIPNN